MTAGILNLDKPKGWTSHDVVAQVRRLTGERRAGHAGTLDPLATGVLLVCLGAATRLAEYLQATQKTYRATVRLGQTTTTGDAEGEITAARPVPPLTVADLEEVLAAFRGPIVQRPPAHSAIKQDGVPLYRRARRGEVVEAPPRTITIYELNVVAWMPPHLMLDVVCSSGTYIRSLARDLGERVGCGGHLADLCRTASGRFRLEDAVSWERLASAVAVGEWKGLVQPPHLALDGFTCVTVDAGNEGRLRHGMDISCLVPPPAERGYALSASGDIVALLRYDVERRSWRPYKVLAAD
ncbi:MAG: tRNA pseudouridine(55) synthase TruB [Anaerolineae bacterium]|nr:tRNA pseudouridine(55) synthase TruB [Anaerolineae bacterium]